MPSKVYFSDLRTSKKSLTDKLKNLMKAAGFETINFEGKYVAVKMHFGEPGNLAFLRPNWAEAVCSYVKALGGKPFLTDCNTLYVGGRKNGLDHLTSAFSNGFTPLQTGVHTIIADGIKGTDEAYVPLENGEYVKSAKIGRALADADIIISLSHFKGHQSTGFGGALKNIGMGGGSRAGKMEMHSASKPTVDPELCIGCGACIRCCAHDAPQIIDGKSVVDFDKCVGCGRCIGECPVDAMHAEMDECNSILGCKIAEYAYAICKDKPNFHVSIAIDISPYCDCHACNDLAVVPNIGMFASFDPVALDMACADAVNAEKPIRGSLLDEAEHVHGDHFTDIFPNTSWHSTIEHAEKLGFGTEKYELIII